MVEKGQKVRAHYRGTFDDGTVFDSSYDRGEPIEFVAGVGQMIPGFDAAILEMSVGEQRDVHIPAAEAYGERREDLVEKVPQELIPNIDKMPVGERLMMRTANGRTIAVKLEKIENGLAYFDLNHEMAGRDLNFTIELVEVLG